MKITEIFALGYNGRSDDCDYGRRGDHHGYRKSYSYRSHGKGYRSYHNGYSKSGHYNRGLLGILG